MGNQKTLILIDGHALAFRQYYALERTAMKTKDGTPTWAVYGFFKAVFDLLKNNDLKPDAIGVAFDVSHHTFRTEEYTEYKANREAMPDPMKIQMELIYEGLQAFNIPIYTKEGFEADDVIGTISKRACDLGHKVYILTGDQDSFQLIRQNGCIKVIIPSKGELVEYDWEKVHEKLGVYPNQVIDYKALRGDTSDNIPGVRGIGEKIAVNLLSEFKTVDNVLANIDKITSKSVQNKLTEGIEDAKMSKFLATIVQDVDIDFNFENTKIELPDIAEVTEFLRKLQFYSFLKNIEFILKSFDKNNSGAVEKPAAQTQTVQIQDTNGQLGLFAQAVQNEVNKNVFDYDTTIILKENDFEQMCSEISAEKLIGLKVFADFKNSVNFNIFGFGISLNKDFSYENDNFIFSQGNSRTKVFYIPLNHKVFSSHLDEGYVINKLSTILTNDNIKKITHDIKTEDCIFKTTIKGVVSDTMLCGYIKNSGANTDFDIQCMEQINHILPTMVSNEKKESFADKSEDFIKLYVGDFMTSLFKLTQHQVTSLDEKEYKILENIEIPLAHVLAKMELNGVSLDVDYLAKLTDEFGAQTNLLEKRIYEIAGEEFNINSPKQVAHILFEKMQLNTGKKRGKSKNSTGADILNELAQDNEIAGLILEYRKYTKLQSTYTQALPALIDPKDNKVHTSFNQAITTTGRLSSSNPNLQNIPARTEEGNKIRQAFIPSDKENGYILSADYSQIELRLLAHVSEDKNLIEAFKSGIDVHTLTASKVFDVAVEDVTKEMRYKAKAVNFGIVYGQSKYGLAKSLKITADEAQDFIEKYFKTYPSIRDYMENMIAVVEEKGYVETIFGRKRYLENEINSPNGMIREFARRAAINHPMQGSASDLIKIAMIDFDKKLKDNNLKSELILQVHDELVVDVHKDELDEVKKLVLNSMELNQPLRVPLLIDIGAGNSWKES